MTFVPYNQTAVVVEPANQSLHFPPALVSTQLPTVLGPGLAPVASVRSNHLDTLLLERLVKRIGVVRFVSDKLLGRGYSESSLQSTLNKGDFMRRSTLNVYGEWKRRRVCNDHDLCTFAPLGLSDAEAPFFATTKVPSMKHSDKSMSPRSSMSRARVCKTISSTPVRTQRWKRRWQVWYGGYRLGRSIQGAPVRSIHRMPSSTSRLLRHGLPRPSSRRGSSGISGSSTAHCSSVRFNFVLTPENVIIFSVSHL